MKKEIKKEIEKILWSHTDKIYSNQIPKIVDELYTLIQIIFDPENQPNQLGIKSPFEGDKSNFQKAVEPAIRYLFKNHDPYTKIYIDYSSAELLQEQRCHNLNSEIPD
jgi:hypothetical protein